MNRKTALVTIGAAGAAALAPASASAADIITIGELPIDGTLEPSYAEEQGFIKEAGFDANIQVLSNGAAAMAAVIGGSLDIGNTNVFSVLSAHERGVPLLIVAPSGLYNPKVPATLILVSKESPIQTARDLNGKLVAVNGLKNIDQYGPMAWIDKNGGDSQSVHFTEMPFNDMSLALSSRRVDAAVVAQPFASNATDTRVLGRPFDAIAPSFITGCWVATESWIRAHPDLMKKFTRLIYRTAAWANAHQQDTAKTLVRVAKIDPTRVASLPRATFAERYNNGLVEPIIATALKYGAIAKSVRPEEIVAPGMPWTL